MKGFTLVEIVVVTVILMTIALIVTNVVFLSSSVYLQKKNSTEVLQNGRVAMDAISREVRQARRIVTNLSENKEEASREIIFQDGHRDAVYIDGEAHYYYIQYIEGEEGRLKRNEFLEDENFSFPEGVNPETESVIGEHVSKIKFWGSRPISIFIKIEKDSKKIQLFNMVFSRNI